MPLMIHNAPVYSAPQFANSTARGPYGDAVVEMDWSVGVILKLLKELDIDNNTFVVWASDNGPALYQQYENPNDTDSWSQAGSAGPLYGGKGTTWEGGITEFLQLLDGQATYPPTTVSYAPLFTNGYIPHHPGVRQHQRPQGFSARWRVYVGRLVEQRA